MTSETNLKTVLPWLQENNTPVPSTGGTVRSFTHDLGDNGPILICVHGWPQSSYMYVHVPIQCFHLRLRL
jgi:pimeloyl-ACP methyl ester carboxylesterase